MSVSPLITFKAGKCELDDSNPPNVKCSPTPGYIYLYVGDDELVHFCWRPRSAPASEPELDLLMIPGDGSFIPYTGPAISGFTYTQRPPTNGRIYVLKFNSSSQRQLFWMQSKSQHPDGLPCYFSPRDGKIGHIVDMLLNGEEVDVADELRNVNNEFRYSGRSVDDDETMEDADAPDRQRHGSSSGGAGADATGGDIREEGEGSREGGADGGRAAAGHSSTDASTVVQNFLNSLKGTGMSSGGSRQQADKPFTTLPDLLASSVTLPVIESADDTLLDSLCSNLPPMILLLAQDIDDIAEVDPASDTAQAAISALSSDQKRDILRRVARSPQLHQSLGSLTMALRDGGLPTVGEALKIKVENGGFRGAMPLGGGEAVEAFLDGVKRTVQEEKQQNDMDTD
ncbi:hypothetical protein EJ05DRAFT_100214 [Pseudovirgaria hyperparasitica]|uniref:Pru domain-containing protein n=1 Tax=Pseudovirgaria hyperparasitica TaxID=470096 RepID=A0A6A6W0E3_9PEZI|nr:uncharacterized protein EJ05DRAFT_100214 [Pseudovirgaria hyperparasitica]KAF2755400.1 hypothetical protein EJ05DRAFT_100214 [Pseudovirgaria hyperparasitica]